MWDMMRPMTMIPVLGSTLTALGALALFVATLRIGRQEPSKAR